MNHPSLVVHACVCIFRDKKNVSLQCVHTVNCCNDKGVYMYCVPSSITSFEACVCRFGDKDYNNLKYVFWSTLPISVRNWTCTWVHVTHCASSRVYLTVPTAKLRPLEGEPSKSYMHVIHTLKELQTTASLAVVISVMHVYMHVAKCCAHMSPSTFIDACYDFVFYSEKQLPHTRLNAQ